LALRSDLAGICGVIGPLTTSALTLTAIINSSWFSWTSNALSDLGVEGMSAAIFNFGLIAGGLITAVFAVGLWAALKESTLGQVGAAIFTLDTLTLSSIGVFPEAAGSIHLYISVAFFTFLPISLLTIGAAIIHRSSERGIGIIAFSTGIAAAAVWIPGYEGLAIPEAFAYLSASVWSITAGLKLYTRGFV